MICMENIYGPNLQYERGDFFNALERVTHNRNHSFLLGAILMLHLMQMKEGEELVEWPWHGVLQVWIGK